MTTILPAKIARKFLLIGLASLFSGWAGRATEQRMQSPDQKVTVVISDVAGLRYRVVLDGRTLVADSPLGLEFEDGTKLGPAAAIRAATSDAHDGTWENRLGNRRMVSDRYTESKIALVEAGAGARAFGLVVRVYDNGVAFRYDLPAASGLREFVLTNELTEFRFEGNFPCRLGTPSSCAESFYPPARVGDFRPGYQGVVPLLVQTPAGFAAISESDVRDWAGMFIQGGADRSGFRVNLADRQDQHGKVVSRAPRVSPWRVIMLGRTAGDLVGNDLIDTLATPSVIGDAGWVQPGACAWDSWWTGLNPYDPAKQTGVDARGTTESHREYIAFAAEMGWPYQLVDWFWYRNMSSYAFTLNSRPKRDRADFTRTIPEIDLPGILAFAKSKKVRLWIWAHSLDLKTFGVEKALAYLAGQGFVGVKIDFINSQSQETVQWCERVLAEAARRHLMIDFHGVYHPTGLARTYPNFLTQEGVAGEEADKFSRKITPDHQLSLVFTRGLLGPMDYTPGGFLNRWPKDFAQTSPTQVQGSRARALALPVLYLSPLTVFCDHPANYRGQPGIEFYREFPTVWEDTVVLDADLEDHVAMARRHGDTWRIGAINRDAATELELPLSFLSSGVWELQAFADDPDPAAPAVAVEESTTEVRAGDVLKVRLSPAGGYAATLKRKK